MKFALAKYLTICSFVLFSSNVMASEENKDNNTNNGDDNNCIYHNHYFFHPQHKICKEQKKENNEGWNLEPFLGIGIRGVLAEEKKFANKLTAEIGSSILYNNHQKIALGFGTGKFFVKNATLNYDMHLRAFLDTHGFLYTGAGLVLGREKTFPYFILGIGNGLYTEMQFRSSSIQPIAGIFAFGLRFYY